MDKPMRIVIDARMYGLEHAGIGRYVASLVREMKNEKLKIKNLEIILLVRSKNLEEIKREVGDSFKTVLCNVSHYSFAEQIFLPLQLIKLKPDLVHLPHFNVPVFYPGKFIVTIHDLIKHTFRGRETTTRKSWFYWLKYLGYRFVFNQAVWRAEKILVPSQTIKQELVKTYNLPEERIVVTYEGISEAFRMKNLQHRGHKNLPKAQKILDKYKIRKPFMIYTGSVYPHKNIERLVKAVKCLEMSLVIACARSVFYERLKERIKQMEAERFVNLVGFVPDEELAVLYTQAEAFVFPTLSEGFGLPGLEAMATGCPVVCSDIAVLREIYGEAALYFDPYNPGDIAEKIKLITGDYELRQRLKKLGPELAEGYSWQKMAEETLRVYNIL